jgi:tetratricopeptide (TPR) repeat protein
MVDDGLPWFQDLWDYTDFGRSADRFREALPHETDPDRIAQLTSQLARTRCLLEDYDGALALLDAIDTEGLSPVTRARLMLERGRVLNDTHTTDRGVALFEQVWAMTLEAGADYLAADAAHMLAWIGEDTVGWTQRGLDLVERSPLEGPRRWIPTLRGNLGNLLRREGRLAEAEACYGALVAWAGPRDGHRRWGEVGLANVLRHQRRIDEALSIVARLAEEHPHDDRLGGFIAECHGFCLVASGADGSAVLARAYRLLKDDVFLRRSEPERLEALRAAAGGQAGSRA